MGISAMQQAGFINSNVFHDQVNAVVKEQSLIKADTDDGTNATLLANVVRNPGMYGFVPAIVADAGWATTYDAWANNPTAADYDILSSVQKRYNLLTGYTPPPSE